MGTIDDYLADLPEDVGVLLGTLYAVARSVVPEAEQGTGYGMPALVHRGKPLLSLMSTKKHLSAFPFSAGVVAALEQDLTEFDHAKGTVRFQLDAPIPPSLVRRMTELRRDEITGS